MSAPTIRAYGRDDILANLNYFFGGPAHPEKLQDYKEHHAQTFHFPDAYVGQNDKLRETLNNLVLKQPQDWHTTVGLPFVAIVGTSVEWDEMRFDVRLLQRVPYEGVSRMATSLRRRHRDRVVRRGIGLIIESDFYATEAGRSHFADQLTGIRYCVQETCNFDAIFAYLTASNYDFQYDINRGLRPRRSLKQAMQQEVNLYGIVQKEQLGMDKAVETGKYRMSRYGVTPNLLIVPPQLSLYMSITPEEKIMFKNAGQPNQSAFDAATPFEARGFRGLGVVQSNPYEMSEDAEAVQMLQRHTQVGEYYLMTNQEEKFGAGTFPAATDPYSTIIFNEEEDRLETISVVDALVAAHNLVVSIMGPDGMTPRYEGLSDAVNTITVDFSKKVRTYAERANPTKAQRDTFLADVKTGGRFNLLILRPFIEHTTLSSVVTVSGRDTGATLFGPADMQLSANTSTKTIEGHYTCHTKAVITKPQNVLVLRDIMLSGYVAGGNCTFFDFSAPNDSQGINRRLGLEDGLDPQTAYASLIAVPLPADAPVPSAFSFTGKGCPWEPTMQSSPSNASFIPEHIVTYLDAMITNARGNVDAAALQGQNFMAEGDITNEVVFVGPHRRLNPYSENKMELVPGQGHLGPDAVPGDKRWRSGESVSVQTARQSVGMSNNHPGTLLSIQAN